jgi:hypothetical protein
MQITSTIQGTFGGGASDTVMHPVVVVAMAATIACMLGLPRKYVIVPFLLALFLLPAGQQLYIGGVHLYVPRILVLVGMGLLAGVNAKSRTRIFPGGWNDLDKIFTCWAISRTLAVILLNWGNTSAIINQVAFLWDTLGGYYFLRYLIRDTEDIKQVVKTLAIIVAILGVIMLNEKFHSQNLYGYLGSGPIVPVMRDGAIRAQGPFEHPLLAGSFAATLLPFFIWLWQSRKTKLLAVVGVAGCTAMVICCASSTPLISYLAAIVAICFWPLRGKMRTVRWVFVIMLIGCQIAMKVPVWFLLGRMDIIAGNSGYHRAMLIDTFVRHISDWWLIGTNKAVTWGYEMDDLCEQWVAEGETGGLATLVCFILLISHSFSRIGKARKRLSMDPKQEWLLWVIGVALFSHCVGFFGISYFDQTRFAWFALIAIISAATIPRAAVVKVPKREASQAYYENEGEVIVSVLLA